MTVSIYLRRLFWKSISRWNIAISIRNARFFLSSSSSSSRVACWPIYICGRKKYEIWAGISLMIFSLSKKSKVSSRFTFVVGLRTEILHHLVEMIAQSQWRAAAYSTFLNEKCLKIVPWAGWWKLYMLERWFKVEKLGFQHNSSYDF